MQHNHFASPSPYCKNYLRLGLATLKNTLVALLNQIFGLEIVRSFLLKFKIGAFFYIRTAINILMILNWHARKKNNKLYLRNVWREFKKTATIIFFRQHIGRLLF